MRVGFVAHYTHSGLLGGADRSLLVLLDGLKTRAVDPFVVISQEEELAAALRDRDIPLVIIPYRNLMCGRLASSMGQGIGPRVGGEISRMRNLGCHLIPSLRIAAQLKRWKIDLVHSNSAVVGVGFLASRLAGIPHVWHLRELPDRQRGMYPNVGWRIYRTMLRSSERCIAISRVVQDLMYPSTEKTKCPVVYNGAATMLEFDRVRRREHPFQNPRLTFLIMGGLCKAKGQHVAIKALARVRDAGANAQLVIAGGGEEAQLRQLVLELNLEDSVTFLGQTTDPWAVLRTADVKLMCSEWEPMGRVTIEAMAAGTPVIGRDAGGTSELIQHMKTGILYKGGAKELAQSMCWVLDHRDETIEIAENAWRIARLNYSAEQYVDGVVQVYQNVLGVRRERVPIRA